MDFALTHPDRTASLPLAGPGLGGFPRPPESNARFWAAVEAALEGGPERAVEMWLKDPYMAPAMENPALAPKIRSIAMENAHVWLDNPILGRPIKPPAYERLAEIEVPTLVVVGDRDVPDIQAIVARIESTVPGVRKVVVKGAGHMVNMEWPEEFNRALHDHLARHAPPAAKGP